MPSTRSAHHPADECGLPVLRRCTGRVVVVDDRDRVLLLQGCDPVDLSAGTWWFTVGGGVEEGETVPDGARRELAEETGIDADVLDGPVRTVDVEFDFLGLHIVSHDAFFLLRVAATDVRPRHVTDIERRSVLGHRWWPVRELAATRELVYPEWLPRLLPDLLAGGPVVSDVGGPAASVAAAGHPGPVADAHCVAAGLDDGRAAGEVAP